MILEQRDGRTEEGKPPSVLKLTDHPTGEMDGPVPARTITLTRITHLL